MKFIITEAAYSDLDDIWFYTFQKWSENQANKYFETIIREIELISQNPQQGKRMTKIKSDFFYFRSLSHYIFYKQDDESIQIIRILHKMMDFSKHLD